SFCQPAASRAPAASLRERCAPLDPAARQQNLGSYQGRQASGACPERDHETGNHAQTGPLALVAGYR
ncbi:MAG: hypothetical protein ACLPN6_16050, partial [Streptosporangiaceae bacterium]